MSAFRTLTSYLRSERRSKKACPYSRPQPRSSKPTRRSRYWDFFNFFAFVTPYSDEDDEEEEREVEALAFNFDRDELLFGSSDKDSLTTETDSSASSSEESATTMTSDTSVETVETAATAELEEPVEAPAKPSESSTSTQASQPMESASVAPMAEPMESRTLPLPATESASVIPPRGHDPAISTQPPQPSNEVPPSLPSPTSNPVSFDSEEDILDYLKRKTETREKMTNSDYLGLKEFLERTRGECTYKPIKLRFEPRHTSSSTSPSHVNSPMSTPAPPPPVPCSAQCADASVGSPAEAPGYISGFHSSNALPTFKNNIRAPRPPKVLKEDPNGTYIWRGAGSARSTEEGRKRKTPSVAPSFDPYKRRKLFDEAMGPATVSIATASQSSPDILLGDVSSVPSGQPQEVQHTTPHVPSPLRNVVNGPLSPPPKQPGPIPTNLSATTSRSAPANQTASAALLQEVVERVMPRRPRYSDVINPYQQAAPVKPVIKPMEKKRMSERRARTNGAEKLKESSRPKEPEKRELTAREIIEATVPKGAKRSRPPPGLTKARATSVVPSPVSKRVLEESEEELAPAKKRRTVTVEEVSEEDGVRSRAFPTRPNVIIESRSPSPEPMPASTPVSEVSDKKTFTKDSPKETIAGLSGSQPIIKEIPMKVHASRESSSKVAGTREQNSKYPPTKVISSKESSRTSMKHSSAKGPSNHFSPLMNSKVSGKSSVPREPSKLRTSFLPDECENEEPKTASPTPPAVVTMTTPGMPLADIQEKKDPKEVALTLPLNDLPSFIFKTPPALMAGDHTDARVAAKELPVTSLPKFDFSKARTAMNGLIFPAVPVPTIQPFDFESAGVKSSVATANGQWQCRTCMLQNSASALEKCSICEAPRDGAEKPKKVAVNGVKSASCANGKVSPPKSNLASTSPDVKTFDFAAAGLRPKEPVANGQWTCSVCMLQNPTMAVEKCSVCDSPKPGSEKTDKVDKPKKLSVNGSTRSSSNLTNGTALPAKSFDFAAAGLKLAATPSNDTWHCPTCMLQNPATAVEKCKVCDSPRPGMEKEKKVSSLPVVPLKSMPQLVPKSFDWAAAGIIPKFNATSWTCGTCMLSNPPTETEKCKVCDASRS